MVYDCYDDYFCGAAGRQLDDLRRREAAILAEASLVLVASERLFQALEGRARRVCLVPNGVDAQASAQALDPATSLPPDVAGLPHPIIGFVGRIGPRLDLKLLAQLVAGHPQWSFVLVGSEEDRLVLRADHDYARFRTAPNTYLLGPRPYESLPGYLKSFDVCVIPYALSEFNLVSSPLKLYEYLGAGKPIVSTRLPAVIPFDGLVRLAEDAASFGRQIGACLEEDGPDMTQPRVAAAMDNSWDKRARQILRMIDESLRVTRA